MSETPRVFDGPIIDVTVTDDGAGQYTAAVGGVTVRWREVWSGQAWPDHVMSIQSAGMSATANTREEAVRQMEALFLERMFDSIRLGERGDAPIGYIG